MKWHSIFLISVFLSLIVFASSHSQDLNPTYDLQKCAPVLAQMIIEWINEKSTR